MVLAAAHYICKSEYNEVAFNTVLWILSVTVAFNRF